MIRTTRVLLTFAILAAGALAGAQPAKPVSPARLGVDLVALKSGTTIRGVILHQDAEGSLTLAVPREWLRKAGAALYEKASREEAAARQTAWEQLRDRLRKRLEDQTILPPLKIFLTNELERVEKLLARPMPPDPPRFVWVDVPRETIARVTRATPERKRIALWSWGERLANVETRDTSDLASELKDKRIDAAPPPDLSGELSPRPQTDREWTARIALIAYALDEPLNFQGTGDVLVRSDASRDAKDMAPLIAKILRGQIDSLIKDLAGDGRPAAGNARPNDDWLKPATREAERTGTRGFRATRVDLNLDRRQILVQTAFVVRLDNGAWETIWSDRELEDAAKPRAATEARIAEDPQVKSALNAIKSLGLGADDQIQQAIRFGAATMTAQQTVDSRFFAFRDRLLKRLDGPPLWWEK